MKKLSLLYILSLIFLISCSDDATQQLSPDVMFKKAVDLYKAEEYTDAIREFKNLSYLAAGGEFDDQSKFYLAMCYYKIEQYLNAADQFDVMIRTTPGSELVPDASYYKAVCYYKMSPRPALDQTYALQSISDFQTFIDYYPKHPNVRDAVEKIGELRLKLAEKEFMNAKTYMKMEYYKSATVYFQYVMDRYYDSPFAEQAALGKCEALLERRRWDEFNLEIERFRTRYPGSANLPALDTFLKRAEELKAKEAEEAREAAEAAAKDK